jgi:hypothetical protein
VWNAAWTPLSTLFSDVFSKPDWLKARTTQHNSTHTRARARAQLRACVGALRIMR